MRQSLSLSPLVPGQRGGGTGARHQQRVRRSARGGNAARQRGGCVRTNAAAGALHVAQLLRALCGEGEGVPPQAALSRPLSGSGVENEHPVI